MPADSVGCETWQAAAARPKWRSRSSAARYSSCRMNTRSIDRRRLSMQSSRALGQVRLVHATMPARVAQSRGAGPPPPRAGSADGARRAQRGDGRTRRDHRRRPPGRGRALGPARGGGLRRLDLLRRPARPARARATCACAPARRASPRPATRTSTQCATGSGLELGERADGRSRLARRDRLPRLLPRVARRPRRRRDRRRPGRRRARARRRGAAAPPEPRVGERPRRAGAHPRPATGPGCAPRCDGPPEELLEAVKAADVRGRGGAGFPAGHEVGVRARGAEGEREVHRRQRRRGRPRLLHRQVPDGGQPGRCCSRAWRSRATRSAPTHGFVLVRSEYPLLQARARRGDRRAHAPRLLGEDILGSGFASTSRSSRAPAPTSSARRRRC